MGVFSPVKSVSTHNGFAAVVPDDLQSLAQQIKHIADALYVGTGGHVSLKDRSGSTVLFKNVPSGALLDVQATYVNSAGTTAGDIVALFHE